MELHWLPVVPGIKFKSLLLTYRVTAGSAPPYLSHLVRTPAALPDDHHLAKPNVQTYQTRLFSYLRPQQWNNLPKL